ncbi:hypothetical protein PF002_g15746 [Phytophthora fragariae]|uniref:PiggyBac transposable element-derived protein domain-containing protein n=2 Tax=Phytophthora fragariae TaxID=53985 RepID=A0A6A3KIF4_9STRA|nr:hypothetical protein PF011_g11232 [Phytophthora fragariae]KAE9220927.1 hypothetical protein PF002_g15746 [Phytophthora fragariae]
MPAMWRGEFAPATATAHAASAASAIPTDADVASEVAGAVASIVSTIMGEASNAPAGVMSCSQPADASRSGKRKRVETMESRKRRRRILQGESGDDDEAISSDVEDEVPAGEDANAPVSAPLMCVVDGDPNLMSTGAAVCTGLNSDEDPDVREEPEDEEDADEDSWDGVMGPTLASVLFKEKECSLVWSTPAGVAHKDWVSHTTMAIVRVIPITDGDWDIGSLTDEESDAELEELPESVCSSAEKDSKYITVMRETGWEYDETKFGPDPTYADLYDGSYGPTNNVLAVAEDPLALLFYFMSPKLWAQIAVESNTYHRQSIPQRARAIRAQQRKGGGEVEDLGDIRRRLDGVEDIDA